MANTQTPDPAASPATAPATAPAPAPAARRRRTHPSLTRKNLIGLGLTFAVGLVNIPSVGMQSPDGQEGPPMGVLVLGSVCGVLMIAAVVMAWRTGRRGALRFASGVNIVQALSGVPAFFVDVDAAIKVFAAVAVVVSLIAVVLTLSPARRSTAVVD